MLGKGNPLVRRVRALRRDRALARSEGLFLAEGIHLAQTAVAEDAPIEHALVSGALRDRPEGPPLLDALETRGVPVDETSPAVLESLQDARAPQPVLLVCRRPAPAERSPLESLPDPLLAVATVGVQDPGNLGTIVRTADASGGSAVIAAGPQVDPFHSRCVRATAGSIFRIPVRTVVDPAEILAAARKRGAVAVGSSADSSRPYDAFDWTRPVVLFLGSEGGGLPGDLLAALDEVVTIPMRDGVESLSVGAAAAVLLFEAARQRRKVIRTVLKDR